MLHAGFIIYRYPFIELFSYNMDLKEAFTEFSKELNLKNYAILIGVRRTDPFCGNNSTSNFSFKLF